MIELILFWGKIAALLIVAIIALSAVWGWLKPRLAVILPANVSAAIDKASDYADEAAAGAALWTAAMMFKKHGDKSSVEMLGALWGRAMLWDDEPPPPKPES